MMPVKQMMRIDPPHRMMKRREELLLPIQHMLPRESNLSKAAQSMAVVSGTSMAVAWQYGSIFRANVLGCILYLICMRNQMQRQRL